MKKKYTCSICGKQFDSSQALAGHVSSAHAEPQESGEVRPREPDEETAEIDRAVELFKEGYSFRQVTEKFGISRATAHRAMKKVTPPEGKPAEPEKGREALPAKLGAKDVIPPEVVLQELGLPADGQDVGMWKQGLVDGIKLLLAGARYSQLTAADQAEIVRTQLEVMRAAREGTMEIAERAAYQAAQQVSGRLLPEIESLKSALRGQATDPFSRMVSMLSSMQQLSQMMGQMFGMPMMGGPPPGQPEQNWEPPPIKRRSIKELEG